MADFEDYYKRLYPAAMNGLLRVYTENTDLPHLEKLAIKFIFTIEQKLHPVPQDERREFMFDVYARISQELLAAVGCLKFGSLSGAYQHYRGFMELHAVLNYVRDKPEKRLKKYAEFSGLAKYQKHEHLSRRLAKSEITQAEFDEHNIIWPMDVESFTPQVRQAWCDLWEVDNDDELLKKVRLWHHSANIQNLIEKIAPAGPGEAHRYDIACHTVHFSPMTTNLIGRVLIAQHFHAGRVQEITQMIYLEVTQIALLIDDWMGTKTLYQNLAPVLAQFKDSVVRPIAPAENA